MGKEQPENYEPSAEDLRKVDDLIKRLADGTMFEAGETLDPEEIRRQFMSQEISRRRFAIEEEIFQASDLVEASPDLPYRDAVRHLLSATANLLDPLRPSEERRIMYVVNACRQALRELLPDNEEYKNW